MNIQPISFSAKQRFKYTKPRVKCDSNITHPTLEKALARYEEQELIKSAKAVAPTIKKASQDVRNRVPEIIKEAKLIQDSADDLFEKIETTAAYNTYFNDRNSRFGKMLSLYPDELKFNGKLFDVTIYPDKKIIAVEKTNGIASKISADVGLNKGEVIEYSAKDIYEFDVQTGELTYFAQGHKKEGYVTSIEKEFKFINGKLDEYNEGVAKGQFNLILQAFKFNTIGTTEVLDSFSSMKRQTWNKDISDRFFKFNNNGTLKSFARAFEEDTNHRVRGELYYTFDQNGNLTRAKKDFTGGILYYNERSICID